ncbi:hypothetical protein LTR37_000200 [Vermiconidia calcicola]|uniref:Uncharacterized protein n=1 Tax=Vermiconidia calcicola TaxID=1690605 RepID=A0ACC3P1B1_9PEZI|nr:hypothetical protein LTR37_000200 [Vermiconidia calcicola]
MGDHGIDQVTLLKQQVAAADFLLRNLKTQLKEAEQRAASQQQNNVGNIQTEPGRRALHDAHEDGNVVHSVSQLAANVNGSAGLDLEMCNDDREESEGTDDDDAPGEDLVDSSTSFNLPTLGVGNIYPALEDVKNAVIAHAISQGWTAKVDKRDKTRLVMKCRTGNDCPFHLRAEQYANGARIAAYKGEHSCEFQPDQSHIPRAHAASIKFLRQELPTFMTIDASTTAKDIADAIFQRFGTRCRTLRPGPRRKRLNTPGTCGNCGAIGHNRKTCGRSEEPVQMEPI